MTREEQARGYLEHTRISPAAARITVAVFLLMLFAPPAFQVCREYADKGRVAEAGVLKLLPDRSRLKQVRGLRDAGRLFASPEEIKAFETRVEEGQYLSRALRPAVQYVLTVGLDTGNEKALTGRKGELFYSEELRALMTGDSARGEAAAGEILRLRRYLASRGVELIVMPVPNKLYVYPERFAGAWGKGTEDPSLEGLLRALEKEGCRVCDLSELFRQRRDRDLYLKCDTHWTPYGLSLAAESLARITGTFGRAPETRELIASNRGDIFDMLQLPDMQKKYAEETVTLLSPVGEPADSRILLLGDSYSNIYSDGSLKWGRDAGLAERLRCLTGSGVDKLALNAGGASASRRELYKNLIYSAKNHRPDLLEGKTWVIYEFAQREIALGDWESLDWNKIPKGE
ncbi:MAG: hypothetical protein IK083_09860 [Abditibacteriota bacterium]|nr:hypothetical protein [Abditibacteriota bacterium]